MVKAPKFCHVTPILKSEHWLKINECVEYKLLSRTSKALNYHCSTYLSAQPDLCSAPRVTRSSSVVALSRPPNLYIFFSENHQSLISLCIAL